MHFRRNRQNLAEARNPVSTALALFLSRQGCPATVVGSGSVEVGLPHGLHGEQAGMGGKPLLRLWQALHGVRVAFIER
jgi:hypothetical protein